MNLVKLIAEFGTDEKCRACLEHLKWPDGPKCPRCQSAATKIANREQYDCNSCHYQFSVTVDTIFHDSHLSLWKWFLATYLLCESRKGMSANQIARTLKVSYKTAWYLCHRIRATMQEVNERPKLTGIVEVDETYVGGKKIGWGVRAGKAAKEIVVGIRQRQGELRFFRAKDTKAKTLAKYISENVSGNVHVIVTDEFAAYPPALRKVKGLAEKHYTVEHRKGEYVRGAVHTNTVENAFSLLKRGIIGTWHKVSAKHLPAYLDEMEFRFNNRKNPFLFRDTIVKLLSSPNLEYKKLTAKAENAA